jgi:hypothetical protein
MLVFLALSTLWSDEPQDIYRNLGKALSILSFILIVAHLVARNYLRQILFPLLILGFANSLLSLTGYLAALETSEPGLRLAGFGRLSHPVVSALVYGSVFLCAAYFAREAKTPGGKIIYIAIAALVMGTILLTQTRSALLGSTLAIFVFFITGSREKLRISGTLIPSLILLIFSSIALTLWYTLLFSPKNILAQSTNRELINSNPTFGNWISANQPESIISIHGSIHRPNISRADGDSVQIHANGGRVGLVWPAFEIDQKSKYYIRTEIRATEAITNGIYLRAQESDNSEILKEYVLINGSDEKFVPADREVPFLLQNRGLSEEYTTFVSDYSPTTNAKWSSLTLMQWDANKNVPIIVRKLEIYRVGIESHPVLYANHVLGNFSPLFKRGFSNRNEIWLTALNLIYPEQLVFGFGLSTDSNIRPLDNANFQHLHSIFVSALFYGGLSSLLLLLIVYQLAALKISDSENEFEGSICLTLVVYGIVALSVDGDNILTRINYLWILFWFPLGIALGLRQQSGSRELT